MLVNSVLSNYIITTMIKNSQVILDFEGDLTALVLASHKLLLAVLGRICFHMIYH